MSATILTQEPPNDPEPSTLGAVLYADAAKARPTEAAWLALVRATAARDQTGFAELYRRTHRLVFTLIMRIVGNKETAEELTLDVFHDIWERAVSFDENGGTVLGWVMNQARSRAIDRVRYETRKKRVAPYPATPPMVAVDAPEELLQSEQRDRQVRRALTALTSEERQAIEIAYFTDCTYAEVAMRLRQPPGTIKTRIRSGLVKLREAFRREGEGT
jgi:RNA polymerase sigma-70 factor, ECF subfamily